MLNKKGNKFYFIIAVMILLSITVVFAAWPFSKPQLVDASAKLKIECDTLIIDPNGFIGKTGDYVCQKSGYQTCVSMNSAQMYSGGQYQFESSGPCRLDNVVQNELRTEGNRQEGYYTKSVSCCRLK